jgi:energy-coupling factor transporter ATP-binding protein EcfA2
MSITTQIHLDLLTWFQDLPVWQNEAFRRIIAKAKPDAQDLAELVDLALEESGLQTKRAAFPSQLTNTDLPTAPIATGVTPPRLLALHALENVNSLMPGQRLNFGASGLTVIYGGNGAGKSGYARVLKKACRCNERAIEPVLKNVYQATTGSVTAKLDIDSSGTTETLIWSDGAKADERLRHFAVFDSKAARLFVSDKNEVPSPSVFVKLETLGDVTKHVRERLARMATDAQPQADALRAFIDDTVTGKLIGQINASTSVKALGDALVWSEADDARLLDLEKQSSTLRVSGPQVLRRQLQQRLARVRILRFEMEKVEKALAADKVSSLQAQAKLCNELKAAKSLSAEKALGLSILPGAGTAGWEQLLKAAAVFYAQNDEAKSAYPGKPNESHCVLCQQKLDDVSHARLTSFWQFLQETAAVRLAEAEKRLAELTKELDQIADSTPTNVNAIGPQLAEEIPELWTEAVKHFEDYGAIYAAISTALESLTWPELPKAPVSLLTKLDAVVKDLSDQDTKLGDPAQAAATAAQLAASIKELGSRKRAASSLAQILGHLEKLQSAQKLKALSDGISTRSVSTKVGSLQKQYVTDAFRDALKNESKALGLKRAIPNLTPKTESGRTTHSVAIEGASHGTPSEVFSEGERTALALAYFLADIGTSFETPCAILDDPVTSLDHRIRTKVVERLCVLGSERQVVVFTHDLPFYCELKETATRANIPLKIQAVESLGRTVGIIRDRVPVDAMKVTEREILLQTILGEAKKSEAAGEPEEFAARAFRFYGLLRSTWERAVEELMFNKVVQRFEKNVATRSLTGAVVDEEAIKLVFAAMTKCSGLIDGHDHAVALNSETPDCDEMKTDLDALIKFRTDMTKKRNDQEKLLAHLK